jgi:hypothetical protein
VKIGSLFHNLSFLKECQFGERPYQLRQRPNSPLIKICHAVHEALA